MLLEKGESREAFWDTRSTLFYTSGNDTRGAFLSEREGWNDYDAFLNHFKRQTMQVTCDEPLHDG